MATDFSKVGNSVNVTETGGQIQAYVGYPVRYSFDSAGTTLSVTFGTLYSYDVPLADLRIAGAGSAPANVAAAYAALDDVFGLFP